MLLLYPRTRRFALAATVVFMIAIETGAREYLFGCVFLNMLFLFTAKSWYRVLLPLTFAVYFWLLWPRLPGWP